MFILSNKSRGLIRRRRASLAEHGGHSEKICISQPPFRPLPKGYGGQAHKAMASQGLHGERREEMVVLMNQRELCVLCGLERTSAIAKAMAGQSVSGRETNFAVDKS